MSYFDQDFDFPFDKEDEIVGNDFGVLATGTDEGPSFEDMFGTLSVAEQQEILPMHGECNSEPTNEFLGHGGGKGRREKRKHEISPLHVQTEEQKRKKDGPKKRHNKALHSQHERIRRAKNHQQIETLRRMVPNCEKGHKATILQMAINHISVLKCRIKMVRIQQAAVSLFPSISPSGLFNPCMPTNPWQGTTTETSLYPSHFAANPSPSMFAPATLPTNFGEPSSVEMARPIQGESSSTATQFQQFPDQDMWPTASYYMEPPGADMIVPSLPEEEQASLPPYF